LKSEHDEMPGLFQKSQYAVALLTVVGFFNGLAAAYLHVSTYSLSVSLLGADNVLYPFLIASIALPGIGCLYTWAMRRFGVAILLATASGLMCLSILALWSVTSIALHASTALVLVFLDELVYALLGLGFWQLAARAFPRDRNGGSFAIVGAGFPLARAAGGVSSIALTQLLSTDWLLPLSALAMSLAAVPAVLLARRVAADEQNVGIQREHLAQGRAANPGRVEWKRNVRILLFVAMSVIAFEFLEHTFRCAIYSYSSGDGDLARQFGAIESLTGLFQAICMVGLSRRFLERFGVSAGLVALPSCLLVGMVAVLVVAGVSTQPWHIFLVVSLIRLTDDVGRGCLQRPSLMSLYGMRPPDERCVLLTAAETTVKPLARIGAHTLLLGLMWLPGAAPVRAIQATGLIAVVRCVSAMLLSAQCAHRAKPGSAGTSPGRRTLQSNSRQRTRMGPPSSATVGNPRAFRRVAERNVAGFAPESAFSLQRLLRREKGTHDYL